jgi:hypothetical protein
MSANGSFGWMVLCERRARILNPFARVTYPQNTARGLQRTHMRDSIPALVRNYNQLSNDLIGYSSQTESDWLSVRLYNTGIMVT